MLYSGFPTITHRSTMANRSQEDEVFALEKRRLFAANFRDARLLARYSQEDIAARTGLSQSFISNVETGESDVSLANSCLMARAVGQPLCKLLNPRIKET